MERRDFCQALAMLGPLGLVVSPVMAQRAQLRAGEDYLVLDTPAAVEAPAGKIEVVEFFWYSCPHCNAFEPSFEAWHKRQPKDVAVRRVPVAFRKDFEPQQRLFYTLEAMGLIEKLHAKVFYAIHVERQRLDRPEAIADWAAKQGVDKQKFSEQYNSFTVASKAGRATQLQNAYKVEGVPALGVAGRFYTDGTYAKSMERALLVVDQLVASVRAR
ncbi:MAG: thiol:disulfide interchange protein DsbA/DsbL [Hylemonella sp.]